MVTKGGDGQKIKFYKKKKMEMRRPKEMSFEGNVPENFRKFLQNFEIYLVATEQMRNPMKRRLLCFLIV